jgi:preprotein translocase subunit SecG
MQAVLIIVHLLVAMALIFVVLLQRSEGGALGMGGGGSGLGGLFSPRGAASTLTRTTAILGLMFFVTSMALTTLSLGSRQPSSLLAPATQQPGAPGTLPGLPSRGPAAPPAAVPGTAPATPAAPAAPQLPAVPPTR